MSAWKFHSYQRSQLPARVAREKGILRPGYSVGTAVIRGIESRPAPRGIRRRSEKCCRFRFIYDQDPFFNADERRKKHVERSEGAHRGRHAHIRHRIRNPVRNASQARRVMIFADCPVLAIFNACSMESKGIVSVTTFDGESVPEATRLMVRAKSPG
jgi:hypothetical protein